MRLQTAVDAVLKGQQGGLRKDRFSTLRIIFKQSIEWNTSVYVNFVDFEKAFDSASLDRNVLWSLMMYYGIPGKFIRIIKNAYDAMTALLS